MSHYRRGDPINIGANIVKGRIRSTQPVPSIRTYNSKIRTATDAAEVEQYYQELADLGTNKMTITIEGAKVDCEVSKSVIDIDNEVKVCYETHKDTYKDVLLKPFTFSDVVAEGTLVNPTDNAPGYRKGKDIAKLYHVCRKLALVGNFEGLKRAFATGYPLSESVCSNAALKGDLDMLQWAREHGAPWDSYTCCRAACGGHLDVLIWAHEHGCPWDEWTCSDAVLHGHFEVLIYARMNGCPWDARCCSKAARLGRLDMLEWLHKNGCPWDIRACLEAAYTGELKCLQYACAQGCPCDKRVVQRAAEADYYDVYKWLVDQGYLNISTLVPVSEQE